MWATGHRERLAATFNRAADLYDRARPDYPPDLFDHLLSTMDLYDDASLGRRVHDANGYIDLLDTFSGHIAMQEWQRDRLYGEIRRRLRQRTDGRLRRHWGAVLHIARRLD